MTDNKEQAGHHAWQTALSVLALLLATVGGQAVAGGPANSEHGSSLTAAFDRAAAVVRSVGLPGELVVTDAAGAERSAAFGIANRATNVPNRVGQRWLWASVTKQVTATLVMQEVAGGRIGLDAPIGGYLPDFGGDRAITVRELLQHRSGLPNPSDTPATDGVPGFYRQFGTGISDTARTAGFCAAHPKGQRGGQWEYNNCDYLVLGAVLKAATGSSYAQLVQERVNKPLKIRTLRLARDRALHGGAAAIGYTGTAPIGYTGTAPVPAINVATGGSAAALTGSASDLARFDRGLMTGRLLAPAARTIAWTGDPKLGFMALGVWSFPARLKGCAEPVQLIERRGDFGGTQVRNVIAPAMGRAVILFTNDDAAEFGEVWQGKGLTYELLSAALCPSPL